MTAPVLFLDIDCVLNSHDYYRRCTGRRGMTEFSAEAREIDPLAVERLNRVLDATGARVVLSSVWRVLYSPEAMTSILRERGFRHAITDATATPVLTVRWYRVREWLDAHQEVTQWAAVDDNDLRRDGCPETRFVLTRFDDGLTDDHVPQLIAALNWRAS